MMIVLFIFVVSSFGGLLTEFSHPAGNYMFKVNNRNTRASYEIYPKLTIKIPERCQLRRSGVFIVNF